MATTRGGGELTLRGGRARSGRRLIKDGALNAPAPRRAPKPPPRELDSPVLRRSIVLQVREDGCREAAPCRSKAGASSQWLRFRHDRVTRSEARGTQRRGPSHLAVVPSDCRFLLLLLDSFRALARSCHP